MNKVEIIVANGEIAQYEQFLLLQQLFQKSSAAEGSESIYMWERVNKCHLPHLTEYDKFWKGNDIHGVKETVPSVV